MTRNTLRKQSRIQLTILLSLLLTAPIGVKNCWGQVAGFAQSRGDSFATAESGSRRSFLSSLNPFSKQSDSSAPIVDSTTITQPVATNLSTSSLVAPRTFGSTTPVTTPNPLVSSSRVSANLPAPTPPTQALPKVALSRTPSVPTGPTTASPSSISAARSVRSSLAGRSTVSGMSLGTSSVKSSNSGGVAALLLDEFEEDFGEDKNNPAVTSDLSTDSKLVRRSLRTDSLAASFELLSDEEVVHDNDVNVESTILSTEDEVKGSFEEGLLETEDDESLDYEPEEESASLPSVNVVAVSPSMEVKKSLENPRVKQNDRPSSISKLDESFLSSPNEKVDKDAVGIEETDVDVAGIDRQVERLLERIPSDVQTAAPVKKPMLSPQADSLSTGRSPNIETRTVGPRTLTVGQPSTYVIHVKNVGDESARKFVVTTELPEYVVDLKSTPSIGEASIITGGDRNVAKRCIWKVGVLGAGEEQTLSVTFTPTKRAAFSLASSFDFERSTACAAVEVQEPILEALIEGRDSIEWGVEDRYRLRLRNVGNGDAENVVLNVTADENQATQEIGLLRAGEEKTIEMAVKTVSDDFFTINVHAVGAYGLEATATKKVTTLRGKLNVVIETPELQFVEGEFEAVIHVRNVGNATLQNVDVVAQLPSGVEALNISNQARRNDEKRRVYWVAPFVRPNEEVSFSVLCRVNVDGLAKFEAVAVDQTGLVAQARSDMNIESIAVLAMHVNAPKEPVAVGQTCVYELVVENNGTRDAHDVNTGIFLGSGMKPLSVEEGRGRVYEDDSKALFKKIDCLRAGESVVFRVTAEALVPGNQKVQAMLQSASEDVSLLSEETTYCYTRRMSGSRKERLERETMTAERTSSSSVLK